MRLDSLGRVVIPADIRRVLDFKPGDELICSLTKSAVIVEKAKPKVDACALCGSTEHLIAFKQTNACAECFDEVGEIRRLSGL